MHRKKGKALRVGITGAQGVNLRKAVIQPFQQVLRQTDTQQREGAGLSPHGQKGGSTSAASQCGFTVRTKLV